MALQTLEVLSAVCEPLPEQALPEEACCLTALHTQALSLAHMPTMVWRLRGLTSLTLDKVAPPAEDMRQVCRPASLVVPPLQRHRRGGPSGCCK